MDESKDFSIHESKNHDFRGASKDRFDINTIVIRFHPAKNLGRSYVAYKEDGDGRVSDEQSPINHRNGSYVSRYEKIVPDFLFIDGPTNHIPNLRIQSQSLFLREDQDR